MSWSSAFFASRSRDFPLRENSPMLTLALASAEIREDSGFSSNCRFTSHTFSNISFRAEKSLTSTLKYLMFSGYSAGSIGAISITNISSASFIWGSDFRLKRIALFTQNGWIISGKIPYDLENIVIFSRGLKIYEKHLFASS